MPNSTPGTMKSTNSTSDRLAVENSNLVHDSSSVLQDFDFLQDLAQDSVQCKSDSAEKMKSNSTSNGLVLKKDS